MATEKLIPGLVLMVIGAVFILFRNNISKGASEFYKKIYTKKNLQVMFPIAGALLIIGGLIIILKN